MKIKLNFNKNKIKKKAISYAKEKKKKLLRGDYKIRSKTNKVITYASKVSKNVADDITPTRNTPAQLFPFSQPRQKQRSPSRRQREDKRSRPQRAKRRPPREPYNPYPLI